MRNTKDYGELHSPLAQRGRKFAVGAASIGAALALVGCSVIGTSEDVEEGQSVLEVLTHSSFSLPDELLRAFEKEHGVTLDIRDSGDAGALASSVALSAGEPVADLVYGIDNTVAGRVLGAGALGAYDSPEASFGAERFAYPDSNALTAIDYGDVCVNADLEWFDRNDIPLPENIDDLATSEYAPLLVVEDPTQSSPGLAFFFATIHDQGRDGWMEYWRTLKAEGVQVVPNWTTAYVNRFSAGTEGDKPLVVSYASSPAAEGGRTVALENTCYRQTEYAAVLRGAQNAEAAQAFIDFLLSPEVQTAMPESMYMYPVRNDVQVPPEWEELAPVPQRPMALAPASIEENRDSWLEDWRSIMQ